MFSGAPGSRSRYEEHVALVRFENSIFTGFRSTNSNSTRPFNGLVSRDFEVDSAVKHLRSQPRCRRSHLPTRTLIPDVWSPIFCTLSVPRRPPLRCVYSIKAGLTNRNCSCTTVLTTIVEITGFCCFAQPIELTKSSSSPLSVVGDLARIC
jgi:hypothetical protein